ncbi:MAG TPA: hypothetical protein VFD47_06555 [Actinomycetota bacterium]|nr:hypothetical protein [Actinomycetota bacterium]
MIELAIVQHMIKRGALLAPVLIVVLLALEGLEAAGAGAIGLGLALLLLWLSGRIIGGLAENRPDLLMVGAMVAMAVSLVGAGVALVALERVDFVDFRVAAITLVTSYLVLIIWEAADKFLKLPPQQDNGSESRAKTTRS